MQSFGNSPMVMDNIDQLYAYLKGRSDGAITRAKVEEIEMIGGACALSDALAATASPSGAGCLRRRCCWRAAGRSAAAQDQPAPRTALRVCQDPNNLPFSNLAGEGIENKIAEVFGKALGLPVTYYSFPQRMAFIRNTLRFKLPGEDYPCDIVMGVPAGFDQVSVTKPYYRSTYALVFPKGKGMDQVSSVEDFLRSTRPS